MRVLLCKLKCPSFICFCKPSPHIYAAGLLKLENTPQLSSSISTSVDVDHDDAHVEEDVVHMDGLLNEEGRENDCALEEKKEGLTNVKILKSSLKKAVLDSADGERREKKKKVQWVDLMGKELAEIREFESSEEDDIRYDNDKTCCVIL